MNNKGASMLDLIFLVIIMFSLGVGSIFIFKIFDATSTGISTQDSINQEVKDSIAAQSARFPVVFDSIFLIILVGMAIALFVGAFFLDSHPVFFIFSVLLLGFVVIIAAIIGNAYESTVGNELILASEASFTVIPFVFNNFTTIIAGVGALLLVGLFAKSRSEF